MKIRSPILQRRCDGCRHDRTKYYHGDFWTPPDVEVGCAILGGDDWGPGASALKKYSDSTRDHIVEHGGCPAWQPWALCSTHNVPVPPNDCCGFCEEESARAEQEYFQEYWREEREERNRVRDENDRRGFT